MLLGAAAVAGCAALREPVVPMPTQMVRAACPADTLLVLLPGIHSSISEFERDGRWLSALRERRIAADVLLADAHMGYYREQSVVDRLQADVFAQARAAGYRQVWLAGISLGGFGSLLNEWAVPGKTSGLIMLAPYLGEPPLLDQIEAAGGLRRWQPPERAPQSDDMRAEVELRLWRWLQQHTDGATTAAPPLYLAYGTEDRLAQGHRLLAAALPADRVFTTPGGHDWPQWRQLWLQVLDRVPLPRCPSEAPATAAQAATISSSGQRGLTSKP